MSEQFSCNSCSLKKSRNILNNERGLALFMTVFIITLATYIVFELGYSARFDQRSTRAFTENIQAEFILKSEVNLARALLELPRTEGVNEDWLGEGWALIGAAPSLPIEGFVGEPRLTIVDDVGRININLLSHPTATEAAYWQNVVSELFRNQGFVEESFDPETYRTIGNYAHSPENQVAVIRDWIDADSDPFSSGAFPGVGIENKSMKGVFRNRQLRSAHELLTVPGMTAERVAKVAPFLYIPAISTAFNKINVNTAPREVLEAIGFTSSEAISIEEQRQVAPINQELLNQLSIGNPDLASHTTTRSERYSVYGRVTMPNSTRWVYAQIRTQGNPPNRRAKKPDVMLFY